MTIGRPQMEKQIRGYNEGGAAPAPETERRKSIQVEYPKEAIQVTYPDENGAAQDEATLGEIADGSPKEPLSLEQRIKLALGELRATRNSPLINTNPRTFDTDFAKYKTQLKGILGGGVTARPSIWDMLSDLGAGVLSEDPRAGAYRGLGKGFSLFNERAKRIRDSRAALNQQVGMKALELARDDEQRASDYISEMNLKRIEAANKPLKLVTFSYTNPETGEESSIDVNQNNPAEVTLVQSFLPNARLVKTPQNQVSVNTSNVADPYENRVANSLSDKLDGFAASSAETRLLLNNLSALEQAAESINYKVGAVEDITFDARRILSSVGLRFDPNIGGQELVNSLNVRLALSLIAMTKGPISDSEMRLFIRGMPGLGTSPDGFKLQVAYMKRMGNYQEKFYRDFLKDKELQGILNADRSEYNTLQKNNAVNQWQLNWRTENALPFDTSIFTQMAAGGDSPFAESNWNDLDAAERSKRLSMASSLYDEAKGKLNTGAGSGNRTVSGPRRDD